MGRWGEALAADWLRKQGCRVLEANWRCRFGELDLIVQDGAYLCFVEVKLRKNSQFGRAGEFVDRRKQEKLRTAAELYLSLNPSVLQPRFDVIEINAPQGMDTRNPIVHRVINAF